MNFRDWLKFHEVGTATNAIAVFARPIFDAPFTRDPIQPLGKEIGKKKKKKNLDYKCSEAYDKEPSEQE